MIYNDIFQKQFTSFANYSISKNENIDSSGKYYYFISLYVDVCQPGYVFTYFGKLLMDWNLIKTKSIYNYF